MTSISFLSKTETTAGLMAGARFIKEYISGGLSVVFRKQKTPFEVKLSD